MITLATLRRFSKRPRAEQRAILHSRWRIALSLIFFVLLGRWINSPRSALVLVARPDFDYDKGAFPEFEHLHAVWKKGVPLNNGSDLVRLFLLCQNVRQICREGVHGDYVELGVYKGNSAAVLNYYATEARRRLFLFDTFSGFSSSDLRGIDADVKHAGFVDTSLDYVQEIVGTERAVYIAGLFPDSLKNAPALPDAVAVLHIDCDLYAPMKAGLEYFYPKMSKGGLILLHDYGSMHWPGATRAIDEFFADKSESVIVMPDKSGTVAIRKV
jgi:O-methyltransferase